MTKATLIDAIAAKAEIKKVDAEKALNAVIDAITDALKAGEKVQITGFGTFEVKQNAERVGVNPRDPKEKITIKASKAAKFSAGKSLKDAVNE
jgi:DNA-binding protein HU-beta